MTYKEELLRLEEKFRHYSVLSHEDGKLLLDIALALQEELNNVPKKRGRPKKEEQVDDN